MYTKDLQSKTDIFQNNSTPPLNKNLNYLPEGQENIYWFSLYM